MIFKTPENRFHAQTMRVWPDKKWPQEVLIFDDSYGLDSAPYDKHTCWNETEFRLRLVRYDLHTACTEVEIAAL